MSHYFRLLFANSILALLISFLYFRTPHIAPTTTLGWLFTLLYIWSHTGLLAFLLTWPLGILFKIFKNSLFVVSLGLFVFSFLQVLLFIDTFVYQQYRFHINLFVLELFFKGQGQVISFPWYLWVAVLSLAALIFGSQFFFYKKLFTPKPRKKVTFALLAIGFASLFISHFIHMIAHASHNSEITKIGRLPFFAAPLIDPKLAAQLGVEVKETKNQVSWQADNESSDLNYPLNTLECSDSNKKPNVILITLDSTRYDQLNSEVMPNTFQLVPKSTQFLNHFSGSNSTRGGIFSLFYGLPPLYFEKFREAKRRPVLFDELIKNNYSLGIFASAPLTMPEFDQTVFQGIPNLRLKSKNKEAIKRDQEITDLGIEFLNNQNSEKPFFMFLFYDSPHEFAIHPDYLKFKPYWKAINYFALNNSTDPTEFLNLHRNSVYYVDSLIGQVLKVVESKKLLENTVIIFTSDHGQEFNDNKNNYWGHNSNFTDAQTRVPFFIYWPNRAPKTIEHWTSHYDVPSTLLEELFNCSTPSENYSSGSNLFKHSGHDWILHGTYGDFAIRLKDHFVVISLSGNYQILDHSYFEKKDASVNSEIYQKALNEMRRFYK